MSWVKPWTKWLFFALCSGETGSGRIVESNLCVILSNDGVKCLTAAHRRHIGALTDARYTEGLWWLFSWLVFHQVPPALPLNAHAAKMNKIIAAEMFTLWLKGHAVFGRRKCHVHKAAAADSDCRKPTFVSHRFHEQHLHPVNHVIHLFANHHLMLHFPLFSPTLLLLPS